MSSNIDYQRVVDARIRVSQEIFCSVLNKCKAVITESFPSNSKVIHDGDKAKIIQLAHVFYDKIVTHEDIIKMAEQVRLPDIVDVKIDNEPGVVIPGEKEQDEIGNF